MRVHSALPKALTAAVPFRSAAVAEAVEATAPAGLPVIAFDGVQGGAPIPDCAVMMPFTPEQDMGGTTAAARAATLISDAVAAGARDRTALLSAIRIAGPFDEHGDPVDPPVWLYRAGADWSLQPDRPL